MTIRVRAAGLLRSVGPELISGASDNDPTNVGTAAAVGAQTGYELSWVAVLVAPLLGVVLTIAAQLGAAARDDLQSLTLCSAVRTWIAEPIPELGSPVSVALSAASAWLGSGDVSVRAGPLAGRVFTQADGNLGNFVWDSARCRVVDFEDSGVSDPAYEVADLVEHVSVWLPGLIRHDDLVDALEFSAAQRARLLGFRRLMAVFWLLRLLPGKPGHHRNPPGSMERQADRVLGLL